MVGLKQGCWTWLRAVNTGGYGANKQGLIHVQVFEHIYGPKPAGLELHHICKNKRCYNPSHLRLVTRRNHVKLEPRGNQWGSHERCPVCDSDDIYTGANSDGSMRRRCRACKRLRMNAYNANHRAEVNAHARRNYTLRKKQRRL